MSPCHTAQRPALQCMSNSPCIVTGSHSCAWFCARMSCLAASVTTLTVPKLYTGSPSCTRAWLREEFHIVLLSKHLQNLLQTHLPCAGAPLPSRTSAAGTPPGLAPSASLPPEHHPAPAPATKACCSEDRSPDTFSLPRAAPRAYPPLLGSSYPGPRSAAAVLS